MKLYHFTSAPNLESIIECGEIRTTDPNLHRAGPLEVLLDGKTVTVGPPFEGTAVVWLLDLPDVPTNKTHGLRFPDMAYDKTSLRITVDVPHASRWTDWLTARAHDAAYVRAIIRSGGGPSAAKHWFVVPHAVPRSMWLAVDHCVSPGPPPAWVPVSMPET